LYAKCFIDSGNHYGVTLDGVAAYPQYKGDTGEIKI
jgi:hypothetical protein